MTETTSSATPTDGTPAGPQTTAAAAKETEIVKPIGFVARIRAALHI